MTLSRVEKGDVISSDAWNKLVEALNKATEDIETLKTGNETLDEKLKSANNEIETLKTGKNDLEDNLNSANNEIETLKTGKLDKTGDSATLEKLTITGKKQGRDAPLQVEGNVNVNGMLTADSYKGVESFVYGMIIMWHPKNENDSPPPGWVLCDGSDNRAPNLSDRFIRGYGPESKTQKEKIKNKDEGSYKLKREMLPGHAHNIIIEKSGEHEHEIVFDWGSWIKRDWALLYEAVNNSPGEYIMVQTERPYPTNGKKYGLMINPIEKFKTNVGDGHKHSAEMIGTSWGEEDLPFPPHYALMFIMYVGS